MMKHMEWEDQSTEQTRPILIEGNHKGVSKPNQVLSGLFKIIQVHIVDSIWIVRIVSALLPNFGYIGRQEFKFVYPGFHRMGYLVI